MNSNCLCFFKCNFCSCNRLTFDDLPSQLKLYCDLCKHCFSLKYDITNPHLMKYMKTVDSTRFEICRCDNHSISSDYINEAIQDEIDYSNFIDAHPYDDKSYSQKQQEIDLKCYEEMEQFEKDWIRSNVILYEPVKEIHSDEDSLDEVESDDAASVKTGPGACYYYYTYTRKEIAKQIKELSKWCLVTLQNGQIKKFHWLSRASRSLIHRMLTESSFTTNKRKIPKHKSKEYDSGFILPRRYWSTPKIFSAIDFELFMTHNTDTNANVFLDVAKWERFHLEFSRGLMNTNSRASKYNDSITKLDAKLKDNHDEISKVTLKAYINEFVIRNYHKYLV